MTRAIRWLYLAVLALGTASVTCDAIAGARNDAVTLLLLGAVAAGIGWFMLGGDR